MKRLEAYGFKSFADKINIDFDKGITAIVGPNGSGKSNITDAIRWVLGEQNIRNLRGTKAEDIIFTGSAARKALGVAEVSLVFENNGELPVDFKEVVVTRRIFRSGESEFYINRSRCRLKDIYNLFADTGIGHDGMSIIGQNRIDDILNSKPEDRRAFFEETAGITKYRNRKRETLRKLEDMEGNLVRVNDIIHEIEVQLEPLAEQAEKKRKHNVLAEELEKYKLTGIHQKYAKFKVQAEELDGKLKVSRDQAIAADAEARTAEARKEQLDKEALDLDRAMEEQAKKNEEIQSRLKTVGNEMATLRERQEQSDAAKKRILAQREEIEAAIRSAEAQILEQQEQEEQQAKDLKLADDLLESERRKSSGLEARIREQKEKTQACDAKRDAQQAFLSERERELALIEKDVELGSDGQSEGEAALGDARKALGELQEELEQLQTEISEAQDARALLLQEQGAKEAERRQMEEHLAKLRKDLAETAQTLRNDSGKLQFLERMQQDYEGFGKAARSVLKSGESWRKGVCGAVAELLKVPAEYVTAIEVALGGNLQNIVTEDTGTAKDAIAFLKRQRLGRVTFLPLSTIVVRRPGQEDLSREPGVIGYANGLAKVEERFQKIADFLLARTLVVDTLDNALALAKKQGYRMRIVTLEGELLSPGGSLSGGSSHHKEASFLNRSGEIASLKQRIGEYRKKEDSLRSQVEPSEAELRGLDADLTALAERLQQGDVHHAELRVSAESAEKRMEQEKARLEELLQQAEQRRKSFAELQRRRVETVHAVEEARKLLEAAEKEALHAGETLDDLEMDADDLAKYIHDRELNRVVLEQKLQRSKEGILLGQREKKRSEEQLARNRQEEEDLVTGLEGSASRLQELEQQNELFQEQHASGQAERDRLYEERMAKLAESNKQDKAAKEAARRRNAVEEQVHRMEISASRISMSMEECVERMLADYGLTPERAAEEAMDVPAEDLQKRMKELERGIEALGDINHNAIQQYEDLERRHGFMSKQSGDLVKAKEDLLVILKEMDDEMTKRFKEAFAQIQIYFGEIFVRLFGGGKAELRLLDEENVLDTGVEILVQLPEKKRQNLSALSGGERALTVIALLFSFLRYKPSPFSVLDEIDAPLDEANVVRFGTFLREFSTNTQFIVVTHRKGTMESVDTMYGVTIEDAGVSKILSVKIEDVK